MSGAKACNVTDLEVKRQFVHLFLGFSIALMLFIFEPIFGKLVVVPLLLGILFLLLLQNYKDNPLSKFLLEHFERDRDKEKFPYKGAILYGLGSSIPILLLDIRKACAIIAILSVGDAVSTLIGKFYGTLRVGHKSLEGCLAFLVSSFFAALIFLPELPFLAFLLAFLGALVELFSPIDDNLAVPIFLTFFYIIISNLHLL